jgi:hypothetical protein
MHCRRRICVCVCVCVSWSSYVVHPPCAQLGLTQHDATPHLHREILPTPVTNASLDTEQDCQVSDAAESVHVGSARVGRGVRWGLVLDLEKRTRPCFAQHG